MKVFNKILIAAMVLVFAVIPVFGQSGTGIDSTRADGLVYLPNYSGSALSKGDLVVPDTTGIKIFNNFLDVSARDSATYTNIVLTADTFSFFMDSVGIGQTWQRTYYEMLIHTGFAVLTDSITIYGVSHTRGSYNTLDSSTVERLGYHADGDDSVLVSTYIWTHIDSIDATEIDSGTVINIHLKPLMAITASSALTDHVIGVVAQTTIADSAIGLVQLFGVLQQSTVDGGGPADSSAIMKVGDHLKLSTNADWDAFGASDDSVSVMMRGIAILMQQVTRDSTRNTRILIKK